MSRLTLLLLLGCFSYCNGQNYLDSTSTWYFQGGAADFSGTLYTYHHVDYIVKDTVIGPYTYHELFEDRNDSSVPGGIGNYIPYDTSKHNFVLFLRESNHAFYRYYTGVDSDIMVVSFNHQLHDTVSLTSGASCSEPYAVIDSIDTVYLNNMPRRRFIYDHPSAFILEGVGTYMGINNGCDGDIFIEGGIYLTCFGQDAGTLSLNISGGQCNIPGFVTAVHQVAGSLHTDLFPNPVESILSVNAACQQCATSLYTITGEQITDGITQFSGHTTLNLGKIQNGTYILKISDTQTGASANTLVVKQ